MNALESRMVAPHVVVWTSVLLAAYSLRADVVVLGEPASTPFSSPLPPVERGQLKTDSESQELLERARQFAEQERFDLATRLWEEVLGKPSDAVFTREDWKQHSLRHEYQLFRPGSSIVEGTLLELPEDGLKAYRSRVDGEARAVLRRASVEERERALGEVVRRYFVSSVGDDAAFELACRKLDQFEFFPAARLLSKIRNEHPDSDVPAIEVLSRLAFLNVSVGDIAEGEGMIEELMAMEEAKGDDRYQLLRNEIQRVAKERRERGITASDTSGWSMSDGNPARSGLMMSPSELGETRELQAQWIQPFSLSTPAGWPKVESELSPFFDDYLMDPSSSVEEGEEERRSNAVMRWQAAGLRPVGEIAFDKGSILFKTHDRLVCARASDGQLQWLGHPNSFSFDRETRNGLRPRTVVQQRSAASLVPDALSVAAFGDRVHGGICVSGNRVFTYQGSPLDFVEVSKDEIDRAQVGIIRNNAFNQAPVISARSRDNRLVAYDRVTGRVLWQRRYAEGGAGVVDQSDGRGTLSFVGAPAPYGSLIIAPVDREGGLWAYAFDMKDGEVMWSIMLTAMPRSLRSQSAAALAIDGGEIYLCAGTGHVFSLDGLTGTLNWAASYPRAASEGGNAEAGMDNPFRGRVMREPVVTISGWSEDRIIPRGNVLLVAASDFDHLFALDRRTGAFLWETPMVPFDGAAPSEYVVGAEGSLVFVGGKGVLRAYETVGGRFIWESEIEGVTGNACLTSESILVPKLSSIARVSTRTGSLQEEIEVETPFEEPLGNLFSDGKRLYVFGFEKVYGLDLPKSDVIE
ncbi:MAG: PQQ-binding-like beta-propeller repeat protein [Verrucomicrobiota bacterium]